ncbi:MAG: hypothetical protein NT088_04990, partial [Candidatus Omnitrophica bacterium]|nr:hypothetical protein [Candidatus Omnitrophota bacterium]
QQINHGIIFNTSSNTYSVYSQNTTNIEKEPSTTLPFTVDYANDATFKGMTITATSFGSPTTDRVEFDSLGIPYSDGGVTPLAADGTVTINSSGATSTVTVTKNTGKVN